MAYLWQNWLPYILALGLIYLFSTLFSKNYHKNLRIYRLVPTSYLKKITGDIVFSGSLSFLILLVLLIFAFFLAGIFFGFGDWDYPILQFANQNYLSYSSLSNLIFPSLILQMLSCLSLLLTVYLIMSMVKNAYLTIVLSIILVFGSMIFSYIIVPIEQLAHLIPFNYLNAFAIVNGQYNMNLSLNELSYHEGVWVNLLYSALCILIIASFNIYHSRRLSNKH